MSKHANVVETDRKIHKKSLKKIIWTLQQPLIDGITIQQHTYNMHETTINYAKSNIELILITPITRETPIKS